MNRAVETVRDGDTFVLRMRAGENRFNPTLLEGLNGGLEEAEAAEGPVAVVLTGEGKFFSNGLDLDWMAAAPKGGASQVVEGLQGLYARLLECPMPVIAAVNGHAFAGGAMLALACDGRVMREDRGFFCLPEVDIDIPFTPGMSALLRAKLTPQVAHRIMLSGARFGGPQAAELALVDGVAAEADVTSGAAALAEGFRGKTRSTVRTIKRELYREVIDLLREPTVLLG
jgi:enoyl-CoA hydratase/carnithine racemase